MERDRVKVIDRLSVETFHPTPILRHCHFMVAIVYRVNHAVQGSARGIVGSGLRVSRRRSRLGGHSRRDCLHLKLG